MDLKLIIEHYFDFINKWKPQKKKLKDFICPSDLLDQYIFQDGSIFISSCTPYPYHLFNDREIWFQESSKKECNDILVKILSDKVEKPVNMILQTPFAHIYTLQIALIDYRESSWGGYKRNYFIFTKPGVQKKQVLNLQEFEIL